MMIKSLNIILRVMLLINLKCLMYLVFFTGSYFCEEIFGCGGFIKSNFTINYSRVEVKLYTKHGSLKYHTDCAPNNGYYLIPLYDRGDYILKIEPPNGWSFEPSSVSLHVDGISDPCSLNKDINFIFKGFTVTGQVLGKGEIFGPEGIKLMIKNLDNVIINETLSTKDGYYSFHEMLPGKYKIDAFHDVWLFDQSFEYIHIMQDNVKTENKIIVSGYDVTGSVFSEGEPIKGVHFLLFSKKNIQDNFHAGCTLDQVKGFSQKFSIPYLCYVTSSINGQFHFHSLPPGHYKIVPFYKGEHIEFDVSPPELDFTVKDGNLQLVESFQVRGFSVSGWIGTGPKGRSLAGAEILLNGISHAKSDENGMYHLESMQAGSYLLDIKMPYIFFEPILMKINPNTPRLPNIYANKYSLCGELIIDEYPLDLINSEKKLVLKSVNDEKKFIIPVDANGHFCFETPSGTYELEPMLSEVEINFGIKFIPHKHIIEIFDKPLLDILFTQFRADVQGEVKCIQQCTDILLDLASLSHNHPHVKTYLINNHFRFDKCLPGNYVLTLIKDDWCFQTKTIKFAINDKDLVNFEFKQTGYQALITLTHASSFDVKYPSGEIHNIELKNSTNILCLPEFGIYDLIPVGCHLYKKDIYKFDTNNPSEINLTPVKHLVTGTILTEFKVNDINIHMIKQGNISEEFILKEPYDMKGELYRYIFSIFVSPNTDIELKVTSKQLLFRPLISFVKVLDDCLENAIEIIGKKGIFVNGTIIPPLENVKIQVKLISTNEVYTEIYTNINGTYLVGPFEDENAYSIHAEKEGYVFTNLDFGKFMAYKLAEIIVEVRSEDGTFLPGVLLSLSGGTDYRKNSITQKDGKLSFTSLGPGQYFLRPMLKEYSFDPSAKMIDIKEGMQITIKIRGKRVAYSLYGVVNSLTGEAEVGIAVEAIGVSNGSCSQYQEEAISEQGGLFRIRGLEPSCEYILRVKPNAEVNQHIERALPNELLLKVNQGDITGVRIIVFRYFGQLDVSGNIVIKQEFLPTLKIRLYKEDSMDQITNSVTLGQSLFFYLPSMPIDNRTYILKLESSLSSNAYYFEQPIIKFCANTTFYHFTLIFNPHVKSVEQEVTQGSILAFPVAIICLLIVYHYSKILPLFSQLICLLTSLIYPTRIPNESSLENTNIKRKSRHKRIQ